MKNQIRRGPRLQRRPLYIIAASLIVFALASAPVPAPRQDLPVLTRDEIMEAAKRLANYQWVCGEANRRAPCVTQSRYASDWQVGQTVTGIPYDWGGMDDPEAFGRKLSQGYAAGSHSQHGVTGCTAGIDCSGYVGYCWGIRDPGQKKGTSTIRSIAVRPKYNVFTDMQPGDALNKPGSHIVLFAGYRVDGKPIVYEAVSRPYNRVVRNDWSDWSRYAGYYPLQYSRIAAD
jgi:hypothetical protein